MEKKNYTSNIANYLNKKTFSDKKEIKKSLVEQIILEIENELKTKENDGNAKDIYK